MEKNVQNHQSTCVARLASVSLKDAHAGDFLSVVPSPGLGLLLRSSEFVAALRYRLGHPIFGSDGPDLAQLAASTVTGWETTPCLARRENRKTQLPSRRSPQHCSEGSPGSDQRGLISSTR